MKINDTTGEIEEVATKTVNGELIDPSKLEDPDWWAEQVAKWGNIGITYKLESMNNAVNYSNLTQFLTGDKSQSDLNNKLADLAKSNKDYSKWIKNYGTLFQGANDLVSLSEEAMKISDALGRFSEIDENDFASRGVAIRDISTGIFGMGSTLAGHIPGITGDLIAAELETAVTVLEDGCNILIDYIERLEKLEADIDAIVNGDKETVEGMEAINEVAEAFSPLIDGGAASIEGLSEYNDILNRYNDAVYNYEKKYGRDMDGDGDICDGDPYDSNNPGSGDGSGGDADDQFNDGKKKRVDPIVFDLNNNGFNPSTLSEGANFDLDCNGMAERINWVQGDDAFLAYDRNEDGIINDGSELFGDNTLLANGEKALNGFQALAEFDTNADGIIDNNDTDFSKLLVWRDADRDGVSDEGELVSLSELGIISIILDYSTLNSNTASGATLGNVSRFVYEDGSESRIAEYWVLSQKFNTVDTNPIDIPEDIAALPDIKSMGNAFSLHKAMTLDTTGRLVDLVNDFSTTYDETERKVIIDQILLILTGAETVEADSRGPYIDAQKLTALECLLGQEFTGQNGENPNSVAAPLLISAYNTLAEMYYCELIAKTSLSDMLGYIKAEKNGDVSSLNLSLFNQALRFNLLYDDQGVEKLYDAAKYIKYLQTYYYDGCFDEFRQYFFDNCDLSVVQVVDKASGIAMFGTDEDNILRGTKDQFILYGNGGKDTLYGSAVNDIIYGGAGSDTISAAAGDDLIYGGTGNDTVNAGAGNDTIYGEFGNDTISGDAGDDIIYGAEGNDIIDGGAGNDTIDAGEGNDIIYGGEGNDALNGGEGDDTYHFNANHGNDIVNDTDGSNTLIFGDGLSADDYDLSFDISGGFVLIHKETGETISLPDFILNPQQYDFSFDGDVKVLGGGEAREVVDGTAEDDTLNAGDGFNIIYGNGGNDTINGGENLDFIFGGEGNDTMNGGNGTNILHGEAGNDVLIDGEGDSYLNGGDGDDALFGGAGNDVLLGGEGADEMHGEDGDDVLAGNEGDDTLYGDAGADTLYADAGNDTLYGGADDDSLFGGDGNDTLYGDAGNDYLESGNGNNTLYGGDGDDTFVTGENTDYAYGGAGNDYVIGGNGTNYMYGEDGDDRLQGGEGYDYMEGGIGSDNLSGGNGYNEMYGQEGNDSIYGGNDNDYIDGGTGNDELYGGNGENEIYGQEGNDIIYDGDNGSHIYGGDGDDAIRAGGGNDVIDGGLGDDYIQDDHGDDTIIFKAGYGTDTISDAAGNNTIELSGLSIEDAVMSRINGSDLKISFGTDNIIIKQYFDGAGFQNFNINGTMINDLITTLHGSENDDWMSAWRDNGVSMKGESGNDTLNGGNGDDVLEGGTGNDSLYGNSGNDTYIFGKGSGNDTIEDWNGSSVVKLTDINIDEVSISNSNDSTLVLTINSTGDILTINGYKWNQGGYTFEFADGTTDTINKDTWKWESGFGSTEGEATQPEEYIINGTAGNDWLSATNNNGGTMYAGDGDDGLNGGSSNDTLYGGSGNDTLSDNDGNDILDGGTGTDGLNGGNGTDTYVFAKGYGNDTVNEWGSDNSIIKLSDINSDEVTVSDQWGSNLILSINGTEDTLTVSNFKWGQASFTFEFADGAIATVNKDTWALEFSQLPTESVVTTSENEVIQSNADLLTDIYADGVTSDLLTGTDSTVISDVSNSVSVSDETDEVADQTDLQVMILTENMSAFGAEDNISDSTNITDITDTSVMSQLLVGTQVQ